MSTQFRDVNRTAGPGDLVISIAEIFDRLKTTVDARTLDQVLKDLISGRRNQVRPGELITAELMNQILAHLESLEARVTALEAAGPGTSEIEIIGFEGRTPFRVNQPLTMRGRGFSNPGELNRLTIGGAPVSRFGFDSSPTQLTFTIPEIAGLSEAGTTVPVIVINAENKSARSEITLRPAIVVPIGRLEVLYSTPPVMPAAEPNITGSRTYIFGFEITAFVDRDARYTLTPTVTGAAGWTATMLPESSEPPNIISIPGGLTGVTRRVRVSVAIPAATAGTTAQLTLNVNENTANTGVVPGNAQIPITIGNPPPTPETRVRISLAGADPPASLSGNGASFLRDRGPGTLRFMLHFSVGGSFRVETEMRNPAGWTSGGVDLPSFTVQAPTPGTTTNQPILAQFAAGGSATNTDFLLRVQGSEGLNVQYALPVTVG